MNRREQMKLVDEGILIVESLDGGSLARRDQMKAVDRLLEVVALLGGNSTPVAPTDTPTGQSETNPFYQSILDGAPLTRDLLTQAIAEVEKDPTHWQVKAVYDSLVRQVEVLEKAA